MHIFNKQPKEVQAKNKTERQWNLAGYILKPKAKGEVYWTNGRCQVSAIYYAADQVIEDKDKASSILREIKRKQAKESRKRVKHRKERDAKCDAMRKRTHTAYQWQLQGRVPNTDAHPMGGLWLNDEYGYESSPWGDNYTYYDIDDTHLAKWCVVSKHNGLQFISDDKSSCEKYADKLNKEGEPAFAPYCVVLTTSWQEIEEQKEKERPNPWEIL